MGFITRDYGLTHNGDKVSQFILTNTNGFEMRVIELGGIITHLFVPDQYGIPNDVVLGHDTLKDYEVSPFFMGALIGRYGNRIANGRFELNGKTYQLEQNSGTNCLHSGSSGFHARIWKGRELNSDRGVGLELSYHSPDGEGGFPGNLDVTVTYLLSQNNALEIEYRAQCDADSVLNPTQHSYFNLGGVKTEILDHELTIFADEFLAVDTDAIPLAKAEKVDETPFDFRTTKPIGKDIETRHKQLKLGRGYDHTYVLLQIGGSLVKAARVHHPKSGRSMEVFTTEPGIQFYTSNFLENNPPAKKGQTHRHQMGFCLETQHYPNSPNRPDFPTTVLKAGEEFFSKTVYQF